MINEATELAYARAIEAMFSGASVAQGLDDFVSSLEAIELREIWAVFREVGIRSRQASLPRG
jgi:hypothetical protein